jgi:alanine racemase
LDLDLKDKWIEIDVEKVLHNLNEVRNHLPAGVKLIAVIKADAYGHGAVKTAQLLTANGVDFFAVTFLDEALEIRKAGIETQIMIFSPLTEVEQYIKAIQNNITLTIASLKECHDLDLISRNLGMPVTIHLKVDTGLGRFGLNAQDAAQICQTLKENKHIYIEGVYTHMADAARSEKYTSGQFSAFLAVIEDLSKQGFEFPLKHCANSSVFLRHPHMYLQAVRIGTLLSGQNPAGNFDKKLNLQDPFKYKSRIIALRQLEKGSYLGYFRTYRLKQRAKVAVLPVGFADGLALGVQNPPTGFIDMIKLLIKQLLSYLGVGKFSLQVRIKGASYPIRGKVFMQNCLVEIPADVEVSVGDEVELPIRKTLAARDIRREYITETATYKEVQTESLNKKASWGDC